MKCGKCGVETDLLISTVMDGKMSPLCNNCLSGMEPKFNDISEIDEAIREAEELIARVEKLLERAEEPDLSELPEPLASLAFTPSKVIRMTKLLIEELQKEKEKLSGSMKEKDGLVHKMNLAVQNEEYELALSIKDSSADIDP